MELEYLKSLQLSAGATDLFNLGYDLEDILGI